MAKIVFIHNYNDKSSTLLLEELQQTYQVEILDFMEVRERLWFRGTPSVWFFADGQDIYTDHPAWKSEVEVTLEDVEAALLSSRAIILTADNQTINPVSSGSAPMEATITANLTDLENNPVALDEVTFEAGGQQGTSMGGRLIFSSDTPGVYTITCKHPNAGDACTEIEVIEP